MKIVHVNLTAPYNDGWTYHENLLPKYHKEQGHEVTFIGTPFVNDTDTGGYSFCETGEYENEYGVKIIRLPLILTDRWRLIERARLYRGLYGVLEKEKPDIIFVHNGQFLDLGKILRYKRRHPEIRLFIDNHADGSNSAGSWASYHILHKVIWRSVMRRSIPYVEKFYGVLPARVDFLKVMYGTPEDRTELLAMGAEDEKVETCRKPEIMKITRREYRLEEEDFVIVTGGKIDLAKTQIFHLLDAVKESSDKRLKLVLFGSIVKELREQVLSYVDGEKIRYAGWLDSDASYKLFAMADLAVFPGRHSVYWEQATGMGIPLMVKWWERTTHVDVGGNCIFLTEDSKEEIARHIAELLSDRQKYARMRQVAEQEGMRRFSYRNLAKESIE